MSDPRRPAGDAIVDFYSDGRDVSGRTLAGIVAWDDQRLEAVHDYIQWLFPTRQPSGVNPFAPLVTDATVAAFDRDPALRARLREAFNRMLLFYGLARSTDGVAIDPSRFPARSRVWLNPGNHNHLRLTRIMESLATLGLREEGLALQRCLLDVAAAHADSVTPRTVSFWRRLL
jgi:hypothetical protein